MWKLCFASAVIAESGSVTPAQKVIDLLTDLEATSRTELKKETKLFTKFLNFCDTKLVEKQTAIDDDNQNIESANGGIESAKAGIAKAQTEFADAKAEENEKTQALTDRTNLWEATKADLEKTKADVFNALTSLEKAIEHLQNAKNAKGSELISLKETIRHNLKLADALGISSQSMSLLQGPGDYDYHSNDIIKILETLKTEFSAKHSDVQAELDKGQTAFNDFESATQAAIKAAKEAQKNASEAEAQETANLGKEEQNLQNATIDLTNDSQYHGDLTERCGIKKAEWAQREKGRKDEIAAIEGALEQLNKAQGKEVDRTAKALVQEPDASEKKDVAPKVDIKEEKPTKALSFLQTKSFLAPTPSHEKASLILLTEGKALHSARLRHLSTQMSGPFEKVKKLIQALIERLLAEGADEAAHQGSCATERKEAEMNRQHRSEDINRINADLEGLTAFRDQLKQSITTLTDETQELDKTLAESLKLRGEEKESNMTAIKDAKEGLTALKEALKILTVYYKGVHTVGGADTARVFVQASPVEEEAEWQGVGDIKGAYKGAQGAAGNIFGLLEVIKTDFEREISTTQSDEKESQADYVKQKRDDTKSLKYKRTQLAAAENDLKVTKAKIEVGFSDLRSAAKRQGDAIKALELLWDRCVSVEMTWEERKAKIEKEIEALKKAVTALGG